MTRHKDPHMNVKDSRWAAVAARDPKADGKFFYSVRTTGVYCRPSCASRQSKRENVAFHASMAAAERAGFRPCKRCKPDEAPLAAQHAATIAKICRRIEGAEKIPNLGVLASEANLSCYFFIGGSKPSPARPQGLPAPALGAGGGRRGLRPSRTVTE